MYPSLYLSCSQILARIRLHFMLYKYSTNRTYGNIMYMYACIPLRKVLIASIYKVANISVSDHDHES